MRLLVVEDEPKVAELLRKGLIENEFDVDVAFDGPSGYDLFTRNAYDLLILDVILPGMSGMVLSRKIRDSNPYVPILILTALSTTEDKLEGFDAGADDYLVKPFEFSELLARVKALIKRAGMGTANLVILKAHDLELDVNNKQAIRGGKVISLTAKEFSLLEFLIRNKGRVVTRTDIATKVWEYDFESGSNIVDVYINILRKKIDRDYPVKLIQTRIGMGYYIEAD
ncbi:MAG: response regulator transcription factor [Bacteroidales bacterium]|jgi:DNA-binding response OmpR family regulator|nr:response regulator transcription factor [Bacteroidales bacterium]MDD2813965.1 response regulator transcription factor [Bacteroidales bacterium]MDD3384292.1 response regulator transcription factor [Bacteroidales bacterium]MDD3811843.1 response regulator transcription factor [Bacteroidales bacterium]MDD4812387.1 response regulator transcription factor [Bacteroidales bacterium]